MSKSLPTMTAADVRIQKCIDKKMSFLLDAGAGSGKTYSLVAALNYINNKLGSELTNNSQKVACITFTNVAKDEIIERTERNSLFSVFTIHDFLWSAIKTFQKDLKDALLIHNDKLPPRSKRKEDSDELRDAMKICKKIHYSERGVNYLEGRISHDDLLDIALIMFKSHPMLARIVSACYPLILVDEYQDTSEKVISILLNHILENDVPTTVGFFGDKWQSIYSDGIGEIPIESQKKLELIQKEENYRCSHAVIDVLNRIRTDIKQVPTGDKNVKGSALYINLNGITNTTHAIDQAKKIIKKKFKWSTNDSNIQTLFLTHRLIARHAGYEELWTVYHNRGGISKDRFQSGSDESASFLSEKIDSCIDAWRVKNVGRTLSILNPIDKNRANAAKNIPWASAEKKLLINKALDELVQLSDAEATTIGDVLVHVRKTGLIPLLDKFEFWMNHFTQENALMDSEKEKEEEFFKSFFEIPFQQIRIYQEVLENYFPYSTKHGVKGSEFDTVFVVLNDVGAKWNLYSFGKFLAGKDTSERRLVRTGNLFYVCCSRSKNNLVIIDLDDATDKDKKRAIENIFGTNDCVMEGTNIDSSDIF